MKRYFLILGVCLGIGASYGGADVSLTVYNRNLGLVKEVREIELTKGLSRLSLEGVAAGIDPSSVRLSLLSDQDKVTLLEQGFEYDLSSRDALLQRYIGSDITIERRSESGAKKESVTGRLLSASGGITLQAGDRILLDPPGEISLPKLPEGPVLKPTLSFLFDSSVTGKRKAGLDYLTGGLNWSADYAAVTDDKSLDLTALVTIDNRSGASYRDASLKLVAGEVNRAAPAVAEFGMARGMMAKAAPQFEESAFFEYHLYTLTRKVTLNDNETRQIELTRASGIPVKKAFVYDGGAQFARAGYQEWARADRNYGTQSNGKVSVTLEFRNAKEVNLGIPLPKGRVRVYRRGADGSLEFIGEDLVDHMSKDETVRLALGNAFDITGERVQSDFKTGNNWCEESFTLTLRNHKEEPVTVQVAEHMYRWSNWKIIAKSDNFGKKDSRTIEFAARVPAGGEKTITYTVRYWW